MNYVTSKYEDLLEDFDKHILKILNFLKKHEALSF